MRIGKIISVPDPPVLGSQNPQSDIRKSKERPCQFFKEGPTVE